MVKKKEKRTRTPAHTTGMTRKRRKQFSFLIKKNEFEFSRRNVNHDEKQVKNEKRTFVPAERKKIEPRLWQSSDRIVADCCGATLLGAAAQCLQSASQSHRRRRLACLTVRRFAVGFERGKMQSREKPSGWRGMLGRGRGRRDYGEDPLERIQIWLHLCQ